MASQGVPWSRLIRFVNLEDDQVYFSDAIVPSTDFDVGLSSESNGLKAKVTKGDPLSTTCVFTDKIVSVK